MAFRFSLGRSLQSSRPCRRAEGFRWLLDFERWRNSIVPVDGDPGRGRDRSVTPTDPENAAGEGGGAQRRESAPQLPTHARNAVEEWIPAAVLYGPPR